MIPAVADNDAALAVDQNVPGMIELPICTACATDGSHVAAVAVAQHLHSIITKLSYDDVACTVNATPRGEMNCPAPEPLLPIVRTCAPSLHRSTCTR